MPVKQFKMGDLGTLTDKDISFIQVRSKSVFNRNKDMLDGFFWEDLYDKVLDVISKELEGYDNFERTVNVALRSSVVNLKIKSIKKKSLIKNFNIDLSCNASINFDEDFDFDKLIKPVRDRLTRALHDKKPIPKDILKMFSGKGLSEMYIAKIIRLHYERFVRRRKLNE